MCVALGEVPCQTPLRELATDLGPHYLLHNVLLYVLSALTFIGIAFDIYVALGLVPCQPQLESDD